MTEAYTALPNIMKYYGRVGNGEITQQGAQVPFNFRLMGSNFSTTATDFLKSIAGFVASMPKGEKIHANWLVNILQTQTTRLNGINVAFLYFS